MSVFQRDMRRIYKTDGGQTSESVGVCNRFSWVIVMIYTVLYNVYKMNVCVCVRTRIDGKGIKSVVNDFW